MYGASLHCSGIGPPTGHLDTMNSTPDSIYNAVGVTYIYIISVRVHIHVYVHVQCTDTW